MYTQANTITGWAKNQFTEEKIEYLSYALTNRADFFVDDRRVFNVFIYKKKIKIYCFELQLFTLIHKLNLLQYFMDGILKAYSFYLNFQCSHSMKKIVLFPSVQGRARWRFSFRRYTHFPEDPEIVQMTSKHSRNGLGRGTQPR
jgi:hypothetical protein